MAVAVYASSQDWDDWKAGVQLFGRCAVAHGRDTVVGGKLYRTKFPAYGDWLDGIQGTVEEARAPTLFVFVPESLKILQEEALGEGDFCDYFIGARLRGGGGGGLWSSWCRARGDSTNRFAGDEPVLRRRRVDGGPVALVRRACVVCLPGRRW